MSIITQGLGGTHLITQGYGYSIGYLTVQLIQTLIFADSVSKKWNAIRTFPENLRHADAILHKWDAKWIVSEIMKLYPRVTYEKYVLIPVPMVPRPGVLPWIRLPVKKTVKIYGDVYQPKEVFITVEGDLVVRVSLTKEVYGDLIKKFEKEAITIGDFIKKYGKAIQVTGDLTKKIDKVIVVKADLTKDILGNWDIKGKKDFKRFILEVILEEEDEEE